MRRVRIFLCKTPIITGALLKQHAVVLDPSHTWKANCGGTNTSNTNIFRSFCQEISSASKNDETIQNKNMLGSPKLLNFLETEFHFSNFTEEFKRPETPLTPLLKNARHLELTGKPLTPFQHLCSEKTQTEQTVPALGSTKQKLSGLESRHGKELKVIPDQLEQSITSGLCPNPAKLA